VELKRRRVFRAVIGYGIVAFAVLQIIEPIMHGLHWPDAVLSYIVVALAAGFPVVVSLAWIFDLKAGRIERTASAAKGSKRIWLTLGLVSALAAVPLVAWYFVVHEGSHAPRSTSAAAPSIAVLPFADMSPAKDQDWMCDGIAEEILDALCTVSGLRVAARSSSFQFKGKSVDVREMARALGVSTLLEGSVRKIGDRLRVSARLVSSDGYELWTDKFDRDLSDAFVIQDEIAKAVVGALQLRMQADPARRSGTANPQAYEMYLRGRQYFRELGAENGELARQMFKRAIALDTSFAQPQAGLADVDVNLLQWRLVAPQAQDALRAESLAAVEQALRLDPRLAEAWVARANLMSLLDRDAEADENFRRATELGPGLRDAWYYYGRFLFSQGRYQESARAYEEAAKRNPDDYDALTLLTMPYRRLGDEEKAEDARRRSLEAADRTLKNSPDDVRALYLSGTLLVRIGEREKGRARLDQAVSLRPTDYAVLYNAACGHAMAGDLETALDLLDRAVGTGKGFRAWIENDPDLDPLHALPRFQQILARLPP